MDAMIRARLAELAATAEVTRLKAERNQHWDGELVAECSRIASMANEIVKMVSKTK